MKDVYVADLHCDKKRRVTYGSADIWNKKPLQLLNGIIAEAKPDRLIFLGDIFDTATPDALSFASFIVEIIDVPEVYIIEGNHDRPKVEREYAFQKLGELPNVVIANKNTLMKMFDGTYGIGWCDTQEIFEERIAEAIRSLKSGDKLCLHCNWDDWGNEMDNAMTPALYKQIKAKGILVLAGHEHAFHDEGNFIHLGAIMPMTIAELGPKYYYTDKLVEISHGVGISGVDDVLLLREEPDFIDNSKAYYVKSSKEVTIEDIKIESKDLKIDILSDFLISAKKAGFDEALLMEFIDDKED